MNDVRRSDADSGMDARIVLKRSPSLLTNQLAKGPNRNARDDGMELIHAG